MTEITRRNFLKISSAGVAGAVLTGCQNPPRTPAPAANARQVVVSWSG
jgi:hypothetical protein